MAAAEHVGSPLTREPLRSVLELLLERWMQRRDTRIQPFSRLLVSEARIGGDIVQDWVRRAPILDGQVWLLHHLIRSRDPEAVCEIELAIDFLNDNRRLFGTAARALAE
jgi:hypothetical protein